MTEEIISRIEQAIGCQYCGHALRPDGPSEDFCDEPCSVSWQARYAVSLEPKKEGDRAALLDAPAGVTLTIELDTSAYDRQVGWLAQWFRRHR